MNTSSAARLVALTLTSVLMTALPEPAHGVRFLGLGDLPGGGFFSFPQDISADGSVVVGSSNSATTEAFRWTSAGGMVGLGELTGGVFNSGASGVSGDGSVIVGVDPSASGTEAFRWTIGGGMVGLGDLPGGIFDSRANNVSADGSVVVGSGVSASGTEAFRWTIGGGMVGLGDLPGGVFESRANSVSADGSVVVGLGNSAFGNEAFRWTSADGMVNLGDLPGGIFDSVAADVSADGSVVVGRGNSAAGAEAFRWTSGGGMVGLGDLPGGAFSSFAVGVSADGSVVVGRGTAVSGSEAFVWDQVNGMRSVRNVLLPDFAAVLNGWNLVQALGVSADGRTVVGAGTNPNGDQEAWLAYLADEVYWFPEASGAWDSVLNWSGPFMPGAADDTVIAPAISLTVTAPQTNTAVGSLTVGGGTGLATLRLAGDVTGDVHALNPSTIAATGVLHLTDGRVFAAPSLDNSGIIRGHGTVDSVVSNSGRIESIGDELAFSDSVTNNASTGLITGRDAVFHFAGGLTNDGALALSFGTSDIFGDVNNSASGTLAIAGNSYATFYDDVTNAGTLNVAGGSTAVFFGALSGNGNAGSGDVQALGDLVPGASAGLMAFGGDLTLGPLTNLEIELGGLAPGSGFDQLTIAGDAALAGALSVSLIDGFALSAGDAFEIIRIDGARSGMFAGLAEGATIGSFGGSELLITYAAGDGNDVALFVPGLPGDFNGSGTVENADLTLLLNNWGEPVPPAPAGWVGTPLTAPAVDNDELTALLNNWGNAGASAAGAVPEPHSLALLLTAVSIWFVVMRKPLWRVPRSA